MAQKEKGLVVNPESKRAQMERLANIIESLEPALRTAFILRFFKRLSRQEIAMLLQVSLAEIDERCVRALVMCRERFGNITE